MRDLQSSAWIWTKAVLFLVIGLVSASLILIELPEWKIALLLGLAIWAFCRAYYFAFYVIERYVDPTFRFSGLISVARYWWKKPSRQKQTRNSID